ncbi:MAG: hypothetical protein WC794_00400 [Candidatus Doudnabacteria bacterium]|jgi:hypothetical protein
MEKPVSTIEFVMMFSDSGNAMKYVFWYGQLTSATFGYFREKHAELWNDRHNHTAFKFSQSGEIIRVGISLTSGSKEVVVVCKMDFKANSAPCTIISIDHSVADGKGVVKHRATLQNGQLNVLGLK